MEGSTRLRPPGQVEKAIVKVILLELECFSRMDSLPLHGTNFFFFFCHALNQLYFKLKNGAVKQVFSKMASCSL